MTKDDWKELSDSPFEQEVGRMHKLIFYSRDAVPLVFNLINESNNSNINELDSMVEKNFVKRVKSEDDRNVYQITDLNKRSSFNNLAVSVEIHNHALKTIPRSLFITLVSDFDVFISNLIKIIFASNPGVLNSKETSIQYSDLISFETMEDAKKHIIEKQIDNILRENHKKQLEYLEKIINRKIIENIPFWSDFIEITERRNLLVHTDGFVSSQYRKNCLENGFTENQIPELNSQIDIDLNYFEESCNVLFKMVVYVTHITWKQLYKKQATYSTWSISGLCFSLLKNDLNELAVEIANFGLDSLNKEVSQEAKVNLVLNQAQGYKWIGDQKIANETIQKIDWSAIQTKYNLCRYVILNEFDEAVRCMKKIGIDDEMKPENYKEWPIFKEFRHSEAFLIAYREIFKEDFSIILRET
jgi:hypothetical protein